jgi:general secretion pathway protein J
MSRLRADAGFTLVETLASLAVLALLSLMLVAGSSFASRFLARTDTADGATVEAAQSLLRNRLQRAFAYAQSATGLPRVQFDGTADKVQFYAPPPDAAAPDALQRYTLSLSPQGKLQLAMASDLAEDPEQQTRTIDLLSGTAGLELAYLAPQGPDRAPRWVRTWHGQDRPPLLVRMRVVFQPGDRRFWPDLLVAPAADLDSNCMVEANTGKCRGRS